MNNLKIALKFKPEALKNKIFYETTGKIKKRVNFPVSRVTEASYVLVNSLELSRILDDGTMELSFLTTKASYIVGGHIKDFALSEKPTLMSLTQEGELKHIEGHPVKGGIKGTVIFPQRFLTPGDFWEYPARMEIPYFPKPVDIFVRASLEGFELSEENKIYSVIANSFLSPQEQRAGKFFGKEVIYFDHKEGKIIKSNFKMRIISNIFSITLELDVNTNLCNSSD